MQAIEIYNLTKYYGDSLGVKDVNIKVNYGEIYGFIGQNGAGKSTTINMLMNYIFPSGGNATIMGMDIVKDSKKIKEKLSYVPSEVSFYNSMKVIDVLKYSMELDGGVNMDKAVELCDYFQLDCNKFISDLSLGNKKKVSIVQALVKDSKVIILDEPTSGLDPVIQERLFEKLTLKKNEGCAIFLSSHNLVEVEKYCDRVAIVKGGAVIDVKNINDFTVSNSVNVSYVSNGVETSYKYEGDINELLKQLVEIPMEKLEIKRSSIEDEFMKYYKGGDEK